MKLALDTNVLAYAEGVNGTEKKEAALRVIQSLPPDAIVLPVQALGELFHVLTLKARRPASHARDAILGWRDAYDVVDTTHAVMINAADLSTHHRLRIWDAVMLSAAAEAGCRLMLSEDLQEGFTWQGVTVTNPFGEMVHPLLSALLTPPASGESTD